MWDGQTGQTDKDKQLNVFMLIGKAGSKCFAYIETSSYNNMKMEKKKKTKAKYFFFF